MTEFDFLEVLPHQAETDYRQPLFLFQLPFPTSTPTTNDADDSNDDTVVYYGFYFLSIMYWVELIAMMAINMVIACLTACVLYKFVLVQPSHNDKSKSISNLSTTSATALLVGWGFVIPFWIIWPFVLCQLLDVRNILFRFCIGCITPTLSIFRTTETIYGFTPPYARKSLKDFVTHFASVLVFERTNINKNDKEDFDLLVRCPLSQMLRHLQNFVVLLFVTGALQSYLAVYPDGAPYGPSIAQHDREAYYAWSRYTTWHLYANSVLQAILFQLYLTTYCEGLTFVFVTVSGYKTKAVMNNPLFASKSPSDFWGRRWNLLVHRVLKNGIYKPVRKHFPNSPILATCSAFFASGLFHEWLLMCVYTPVASQLSTTTATSDVEQGCISSCYQPVYGNAIVFFLWQAALVGLEMVLGKTWLFRWCETNLPQFVKTPLIILLGIPVGHYFTEPYFRSNLFFDPHGSPGLPMIRPIK
mmetsp:Transcript_6282/g.15842  ORF Transcript_6282/g.15842 Transcript_6282/m.15842 type:complete len:472 (-) Transcript_6282:1247-2662(-)